MAALSQALRLVGLRGGRQNAVSGSMNHCAPVRQLASLLHSFQRRLRDSHLCPASRQLRRQVGELRGDVQSQLVYRRFQPVIGGDLLVLASLDSLQVGENHVGKQTRKDIDRLVHEQILSKVPAKRMITARLTKVTEAIP
jgi:hypothetical protein